MRRQDREVREFSDIVKIIQHCKVLHLGLADQDGPYIVPLHFGYEICGRSICFYFHSAGEGRKIDIIRKYPRVCFELDGLMKIRTNEKPCGWGAAFESVMGTGTAIILENIEEKIKGLSCIMDNYGYEGVPQFQPEILEKTLVIKVAADLLTGKKSE